jgi:proteasome lid subunit RPN8/RPN11
MAAPQKLLIPEAIWQATVKVLDPYRHAQVEAGLYWYGLRSDEAAVVVHAGVPAQINRPRNFAVPDDALATLTRAVPEPLVAVAAIHTHPGLDTRHSPHDDERAISRKILSLVLPRYGDKALLSEARVHEHRSERWHALAPQEADERLVLVPTLVDLRT